MTKRERFLNFLASKPVEASYVKTSADLRKIEPLSMDSKFVQRTLELTKRVREIHADSDVPVYATSFSPTLVLRSALPEGRRPGLGGSGFENL